MNQTDSIQTSQPPHTSPPRIVRHTDTRVAADSIQHTDSIAADSVGIKKVEYGITLKAPEVKESLPKESESAPLSFILGGILLLFCIIGFRFRNNRRYVTFLFRNMVEVRERGNAFDETVREHTFLVLLNLLWSCCAGLILWSLLGFWVHEETGFSFGLPALTEKPALTMVVCMGICIAYNCLMSLAYITVGSVFSDTVHARMWLKGYTAGTGLLGVVYLPLSLMLLFYPEWTEILLWIALGTFLFVKIVFIWKGFRIFFTQISSWVLFLYYLCSLEIVPLILTYLAALWICSLL